METNSSSSPHEKADELYKNRSAWAKSAIINIAKSGYFTSDRTIEEYNRDIWHLPRLKGDSNE